MCRAKELVARERPDVTLERIRGKLGDPGVSGDEFLKEWRYKELRRQDGVWWVLPKDRIAVETTGCIPQHTVS